MDYNTTLARTVTHLRTIRTEWPHLLAAVETPPIPQWPPAQLATHIAQLDAVDEARQLDAARTPLILREHPAPANLTALDSALAVERHLFDLADTLAVAVQRPVRRHLVGRPTPEAVLVRWADDAADATDPRRWHLPTNREVQFRAGTELPREARADFGAASPGSRAHGVHWAATWIEGRVLDEDDEADLFGPLPGYLLYEAHRVARQCAHRVLRTLALDERVTPVEGRPCPWCGGQLRLRTGPDTAPSVWCNGGWDCAAPVPVSGRRRVWGPTDLPALVVALAAAEKRQAA